VDGQPKEQREQRGQKANENATPNSTPGQTLCCPTLASNQAEKPLLTTGGLEQSQHEQTDHDQQRPPAPGGQ
jgi:hypothetical protein